MCGQSPRSGARCGCEEPQHRQGAPSPAVPVTAAAAPGLGWVVARRGIMIDCPRAASWILPHILFSSASHRGNTGAAAHPNQRRLCTQPRRIFFQKENLCLLVCLLGRFQNKLDERAGWGLTGGVTRHVGTAAAAHHLPQTALQVEPLCSHARLIPFGFLCTCICELTRVFFPLCGGRAQSGTSFVQRCNPFDHRLTPSCFSSFTLY